MRRIWLAGALIAGLAACQGASPGDGPSATAGPLGRTISPATLSSPVMTPQAEAAPFPPRSTLSSGLPGGPSWEPAPFAGPEVTLPLDLDRVTNLGVLAGLTAEQHDLLSRNGFVVIHSQEAQFSDIRDRVGEVYGQPYYLTTDAAFHALHLTFDELLKSLEREALRPQMTELISTLEAQLATWLDDLSGTAIEPDARLALAYLGVAHRLFDSEAEIRPEVRDIVERQVDQILAEGGKEESVLLPGFTDDYGAYRPVGHYAGDPRLEAYFRGMTWLGRVDFSLMAGADPPPSRAPLLITLALQHARLVGGSTGAERWAAIDDILAFTIGESDDPGPRELAALMQEIYGVNPAPEALADAARWDAFLRVAEGLPAPQINSTFVDFLSDLEQTRSWRFLGQRFTLDGMILQNMVFDHVGTMEEQRLLPSGLDVAAAMGSQAAHEALRAAGEDHYLNFESQLATMQQAVANQTDEQWRATFYGSWLSAFLPQFEVKGEAYPAYMRTPAWSSKDVNSGLGSWAELKHDTVLYAKMPEGAGGGGPPSSGPPPGVVEPNPPVFYRMAEAANSIWDGLMRRVDFAALEAPQESDFSAAVGGFQELLYGMQDLSGQLRGLGEIAAREMRGEALNEDDRYEIHSCLGPVECAVLGSQGPYSGGESMEMPLVPVIAAVAGGGENVLEVGVGGVDRIYVALVVDGEPAVAQGGVFSYFEFTQPRTDRLTDQAWRERLASGTPARPAWTSAFSASGGEPADVLAFRVGDVYLITAAGAGLNLRAAPSTSAQVLAQLGESEYVTLTGGPLQADGHVWWKLQREFEEGEGWAVENPEWYERAYGQ